MGKVLNAVEILLKISADCIGRMSITDRQATDGRAIAYSEREREFTFAKNQSTFGEKVGCLLCLCTVFLSFGAL